MTVKHNAFCSYYGGPHEGPCNPESRGVVSYKDGPVRGSEQVSDVADTGCMGLVPESGNTLSGDPVSHPVHYTSHPSGIECIEVTKHMNFCLGNAVKYIWRSGQKGDTVTDLKKAIWYIQCEIERLS